jgi:hypothetical protein
MNGIDAICKRGLPLPTALVFAAVVMVSASCCPAQNSQPSTDRIEGFTDTPMLPGNQWHQHDPNRPQPPIVTPADTFGQAAPAPSDAEILFDGKDLSKWQGGIEKNPNWAYEIAGWKVQDGYVEVSPPDGTDIRSREKWTDFQLHIEWSTPAPPSGHGQARGNSGILINGMYEIQILDSYNNKTYPDGQAGALYGQVPPLVNPSKPPGLWQVYDLIWQSPRCNDKGELTQKAAVTLIFNGVVVQNHAEFVGRTEGIGAGVAYKAKPFYLPHDPAVFIQLQNHHSNPVRFRDIWVRNLNAATTRP